MASRARPKLRPNVFARLARFAALRSATIVLVAGLLGLACAAFALMKISIDPDRPPVISLDEQTADRQAELDRLFPGVEQTFLAIVTSGDPETARQQALALAVTLGERTKLFVSAFVPGTGEFYERNALLYRDVADVRARVNILLQLEPLYHALAAAPDLPGFTALVSEIANAVEQGRSPPGLATVLQAVSSIIEGEVKGKSRPLRWSALAGIDGQVQAKRWYVLATPRPGMEREAAVAARQASNGMEGVSWVWPRRALATAPNTLRDFVVPAALSVLLVTTLLAGVLASFRQSAAVMGCAAIVLSGTGAAVALMDGPLDGATWSFALAVLSPVLLSGSVVATAYGHERMRGLSSLQAVMMAAQRQGGLVSAAIAVIAAIWSAWLFCQLPSLNKFAAIALFGGALSWIVSVIVLPAALQFTASKEPEVPLHWLTEEKAMEAARYSARAYDVVAILLLAVVVFSAVFLPAIRFGESQLPAKPPPLLETPDARGSVHILAAQEQVSELVARLSALPEVGAIRTAEQFLPANAAENISELKQLAAFTPFMAMSRKSVDESARRESLVELQEHLSVIADASASAPELRAAAIRLRGAVSLFIKSSTESETALEQLEAALFSDLGSVSKLAERLIVLAPPAVSDLEPRLLRRFVSEQGIWRIEVMPRNGTGELSFAAAVRRAVPQAAGQPIVSLVQNEIVHHEASLAFAMALGVVAMVLLLATRSISAFLVSVAPSIAFLTLTAGVIAYLGIRLNVAMLAAMTTGIAVLIASSLLSARSLARTGALVSAAGLPGRAILLPPLAVAAAAGPLVTSSRPGIVELGTVATVFILIVCLLAWALAPALARWAGALVKPRNGNATVK